MNQNRNTGTDPSTGGQSLPVASRYFVAKYMADLFRCEPRNIGIILWTPNGARARFIAETSKGDLDMSRIPDWLGDATTYREWVRHWRRLAAHSTGLEPMLGPLEKLTYESEPSIKQTLLKHASKAHWILASGGVLLDPVNPSEENALLDKLYHDMVGDPCTHPSWKTRP
jgi:hypothetical protein